MSINEREQVIGKIKKLLSLSENNPSQEESIAAALKAQALIARFSIEDYELAGENERPEGVESRIGQHKRWRFMLARAVADNFRCRWYINTNRTKITRTYGRDSTRTNSKNIVFYGYHADREAAKLTYERLFAVGHRLAQREARRAREVYGYADGVYNTFCAGFVKGVREELEIQAQALMIVCPPQVNEAYENLASGFAVEKNTGMRMGRYLAYNATDTGMEAGRDAVRKRRLEDSEELLLCANG